MNDIKADPKAIFFEALDCRGPEELMSFLANACGADVTLRSRVEELLRAHRDAGAFLGGAGNCDAPRDEPDSDVIGTMIGPYKLIEQIGEGGMGLVFMAEQKEPVRRKVALKLIKPGMDSKQVIARFNAERQALALMDHPNIAKILDAGTVGGNRDEGRGARGKPGECESDSLAPNPSPLAPTQGRPYFVMELIHGIPITDYCDRAKFTIRKRLELFVQVCRAVQHAHTKGIIHRDLKPGNVLVTSNDVDAVPKIIDFGVAKALDQSLTEQTLNTGFAQMLGTPLYMSPEQVEFNQGGVDTRSDIYSLGVLLYELLTGATPIEKERMRHSNYGEILRLIRDEEPPKPSTLVSTLGAKLATVSERRGAGPGKLQETLHGDLDWIVLKALDKDRTRRYESASAFATDIQRYLKDEPVDACPPSARYRLKKFARRNHRSLVTALILVVALVSATAVSTWQAIIAREAQKQAATEAAIARAVNEFLQKDLLGQAAAAAAPGEEFVGEPHLTVKVALDRAAARIDERFKDQPLVEAAIRTTIGRAYNSIMEYGLAVPHLRRAVDLRKVQLGDDHDDTFDSMRRLAHAYMWVGQFEDAVALHRQIADRHNLLFGSDNPTTLRSLRILIEELRTAGKQDWDVTVRLQEGLLDKQRSICGPTHPDTLETMHKLAFSYGMVDQFTKSNALYEKLLEHSMSNRGSRSIPTLIHFAYICQRAGEFERAEDLLREALKNNLARDDSHDRRIGGANIRGWLARTLLLREKFDDAEPFACDAVATFEKEQPNSYRRYYWVSLLGAVHAGQGKYEKAEPLLLQGYEGMKLRESVLFDIEKRRFAEVGERVVRFYEQTQQAEMARDWREKLGQKLEGTKKVGGR